jgi:hypothetical protein
MYSGGKSVESNSWSSDCGGNVGDVGGDWNGEFNVVWWCGIVGARVSAFVWRWVVGVLGELLCL